VVGDVKLTIHLHLVPRLQISGARLPFPLYVFMAFRGPNVPFTLYTFTRFTLSLTSKNSPLCPDSVFVCFICLCIFSINWLAFMIQTDCVLCEVGIAQNF
jgi:hypothetical protein